MSKRFEGTNGVRSLNARSVLLSKTCWQQVAVDFAKGDSNRQRSRFPRPAADSKNPPVRPIYELIFSSRSVKVFDLQMDLFAENGLFTNRIQIRKTLIIKPKLI